MAIASLILGIVWLFGVGSILAIVLGYSGLRQIRESGGRQGGRAIALAGVVVGIVGLASLAILIAFVVSSSHHEPKLPGPNGLIYPGPAACFARASASSSYRWHCRRECPTSTSRGSRPSWKRTTA